MILLDRYNFKKYQAGVKFVLYVAVKKLFGGDIYVLHSIDKGLFCKIITPQNITDEDIKKLKDYMLDIINKDYKIAKKTVTKQDAFKYYTKIDNPEKAANAVNLTDKTVTLYELLGFYNYFMSDMPESTKGLDKFDIINYGNNNIVLSTPLDKDYSIPTMNKQDLIIQSYREYTKWLSSLNIKYVSDLNNLVADSKIRDFIRKNDIIMDNQLYDAARTIKAENKKLVLIGGPSSSGKTTTTRKLALYLSSVGLNPITLSLDDYFVDRIHNPRDENGNYDFECIEAIDFKLFNSQVKDILSGKEVEVPTFNFITGKKEYNGKKLTLKPNDILIIEGLHCLNEILSSEIPTANKIKIYLCPFVPICIDRHNHLSTVDIRLMRRIVRDNRTRGYTVTDTLKSWDSVRNGETKYIFEFINEADMIINSFYAYEFGVLKVYVEPLLYSVPITSEFYNDARRLISELRMFFPIPSEYVNDSNVIREFIGGSYFE